MSIGRIRYHRNGVRGEGFFSVQFTAPDPEDGRRQRHFVAIVSACEDERGLVAVIDPADPSTCWRGDDCWGTELRHACEVASLTGDAHV